MNAINGAGSSARIAEMQYVQTDTKNVVVQEEKNNAQEVTNLAKKDGMLALMMDKQSVHTDMSNATAAAQKRKGGEIESESPAKTVTLSAAGEGDANKAERLAGAMPNVATSQINIAQANNKPAESSKSISESTATSASSSTGQVRSQPAVEGGTDITAVQATGPHFINVIGSEKQLEAENSITVSTLKSENQLNVAAAAATSRSVRAAEVAGEKTVEAAQQSFNGAITSATVGFVAQGVTTGTQIKALNKEGTSITQNLKPARNLELGVRQHQSAVHSSKDTMVHQGLKSSREVEATMTQSHAGDMHTSALKRDDHNKIQLSTQKIRATAEYANQNIRSGQSVIDGSFNVSSAEKQKEAEQARADRDVNSELANTHNKTAASAAETTKAIREMTNKVLSDNNNAASSIAGNI